MGVFTNVYAGKLCPKVQPLTLLYTIFHEKGTPLIYLLLAKLMVPLLHTLFRSLHPF